jgi:hypothetical protein
MVHKGCFLTFLCFIHTFTYLVCQWSFLHCSSPSIVLGTIGTTLEDAGVVPVFLLLIVRLEVRFRDRRSQSRMWPSNEGVCNSFWTTFWDYGVVKNKYSSRRIERVRWEEGGEEGLCMWGTYCEQRPSKEEHHGMLESWAVWSSYKRQTVRGETGKMEHLVVHGSLWWFYLKGMGNNWNVLRPHSLIGLWDNGIGHVWFHLVHLGKLHQNCILWFSKSVSENSLTTSLCSKAKMPTN